MVIPDDAYGGTYRLFAKVAENWGLDWTAVPLDDLEAVRAAFRPGHTRMIWAETPTNPLLSIADIPALAALAHEYDAMLVVDNTFASPYLQQPIAPRRRRRRALHHQVPRRALRRDRRRADRGRPTASATSWPSTRTRWAR